MLVGGCVMIDYRKRPEVRPAPMAPVATLDPTDRDVRRLVDAIRDYRQFDGEIREAKRAAASSRIVLDRKEPLRAPYNERAAAAADAVNYATVILRNLGIGVPS